MSFVQSTRVDAISTLQRASASCSVPKDILNTVLQALQILRLESNQSMSQQETTETVELIVHVFSGLSEHNAKFLVSVGAVHFLTKTMKVYLSNSNVQVYACQALYWVSRCCYVDEVLEQGGIECVLMAIKCHPKLPLIQERGLQALASMIIGTSDDALESSIHRVEKNMLQCIAGAVRRFETKEEIQVHALSIIQRLTCLGSDRLRILIFKMFGKLVHATMTQHFRQSSVIQVKACAIFENLSTIIVQQGSKQTLHIRRIMQGVLVASSKFRNNAELQRHSVGFFWKLYVSNAARMALLINFVFEQLCLVVRKFPHDVDIQEFCCSALWHCACTMKLGPWTSTSYKLILCSAARLPRNEVVQGMARNVRHDFHRLLRLVEPLDDTDDESEDEEDSVSEV